MISSLMEICKRELSLHKSSLKHLATPEERKPNEKFIKTVSFKFLLKTTLLALLWKRVKWMLGL
jgi:N utilization substance protein B